MAEIRDFEFEAVTVDEQGRASSREVRRGSGYVEDLGGGVTLEMVAIPGGAFVMGSPPGEGYHDEHPQHLVALGPFLMGRGPVTQSQWRAIMAADVPWRSPGEKRPADNISWRRAQAFCRRLSARTGRAYRLPSEAQWEYACRAGSAGPFAFGPTLTTDLANYVGNWTYGQGPLGVYRHVSTEAGCFPPNGFGLYDMHGNVWEWCADGWHPDYNGAPCDGSAWEAGGEKGYRVARGGGWHDGPELCRSAARLRFAEREWEDYIGFRVACLST